MKPSVKLTKKFIRHFNERISPYEKLVDDYLSSVEAFLINPASVNDHDLSGVLEGCRAFWINDDYRVLYLKQNNKYTFIDIGTHEQVYLRRKKTSREKGKEML